MTSYADLNLFVLLYHIIINWGWNNAIRQIQAKYKAQNFRVNLIYKTLWIFEERNVVSEVLSKKAEGYLTSANKNFFAAHPYSTGIGNLDISDPLWSIVHTALGTSLTQASTNGNIERIMDKHKRLLFNQENNIITIGGTDDLGTTDNLEKYLIAVWCEFCFGTNTTTTTNDYNTMRQLLLKTIRSTFYNHNNSFIPIIGWLMCKLRSLTHYNEYQLLDSKLTSMLKSIPRGGEDEGGDEGGDNKDVCFFSILRSKLENEIGLDSFDTTGKVMKSQVFLSVLALDFLHLLFSQIILNLGDEYEITHKKFEQTDESKQVLFRTSIVKGFLFPWRSRTIGCDLHINDENQNGSITMRKGDLVMLNLVKSDYFFSSGPRSCVAPGFVKKMYTKFLQLIEPFELKKLDNNQIIYEHENTPFILSTHRFHLNLPRTYLQETLKFSEHKGVKFYHIHEIVSDVTLNDWIINEVSKKIVEKITQFDHQVDGIISAEARGWLFASSVAHRLGLPLFVARKAGKLPGEVTKITYQKEGYTVDGEETIELPKSVEKMTLVMIDDGIASGITTNALLDIVRSNLNHVPLIIPIIDHHYTERKSPRHPVEIVSLFDL